MLHKKLLSHTVAIQLKADLDMASIKASSCTHSLLLNLAKIVFLFQALARYSMQIDNAMVESMACLRRDYFGMVEDQKLAGLRGNEGGEVCACAHAVMYVFANKMHLLVHTPPDEMQSDVGLGVKVP